MKTRYKYIHFEPSPFNEEQGTNDWDIWNNRTQDLLGYIQYYKPWKQYCFIGRDDCVFNVDCLADIIDFINLLEK